MRYRGFEDLHRWDGQKFLLTQWQYDWSGQALKGSPISGNFTVFDGPTSLAKVPGSLDGTEPTDFGDVYAFTLQKGVTYSFAYRPTTSDGIEDPFLLLADARGNVIAFDDDGGAGRSSILTFTPNKTTTYLLAATSWVTLFTDDTDTGGYTIDIWTPQTHSDAPATLAGAKTIQEGVTTFGHTQSGTDIDMYKIDLTAGRFYEFAVSGGATTAMVELLDSQGNVLVSHSDAESGVGWDVLQSGTYYVRVTPTGGTEGGYTLDVKSQVLSDTSPLEALNWDTAVNIPTTLVNGVPTAYVYFADAGENFGEVQGDGGPDGDTATNDPLVSLGWNDFEKQQVLLMLNQEYGKILGINYVETTDPTNATFRLITTEDEPYGARFYPYDEESYGTQMGIGTFNKDSHAWTFDQQQSLERGGFAWELLMHEFGHAHGIAHPHDNGGGSEIMPGVFASTGSLGAYNLNQSVYTVMSYNSTWVTGPDGATPFAISSVDSGSVGSLSPFDIAVLEYRYGPLPERNTGDNVYTLTDSQDNALFETIWDHGGTDAIAYSGNMSAVIDLTAATLDYSATGGGVMSYLVNPKGLPNSQIVRGGFLIAGGVQIENATGGNGNDMLIGNALVNLLEGSGGHDVLMGRLGDDTLNGGGGNDIAAYNDAAGSVNVNIGANQATGADGTDTLIDVEGAIGGGSNDTLIGDARDNVFDGGGGNDTMSGGAGSDTLSFQTAVGAVNVTLVTSEANTVVTTVAGTDTYSSMENLTGSRFNDRLIGNSAVNAIRGGEGVDVITLAGGNDRLIAEIGEFTIGLKTGLMTVDVVTDFDQAGNDKIDLSGLGSFTFKGTASNQGAGTVWYKTYTSVNGAENALGFDFDSLEGAGNNPGPVTVVYVDKNGGGADAAIILLNTSSVSASDDFILS